MIVAKRNVSGLRASRLPSRPRPARRNATLPRVESLESRALMAAGSGLSQADLAHETLDYAVDLGHINIDTSVLEEGSLGNGPEGAADVEWYSFTLDRPSLVTMELQRQVQSSSFQGVLSLFNNDPSDYMDPYDVEGHRLLDQVDGKTQGGVATLDQLLGTGTYYLAVSGDGNSYFHPLLAGSGTPGSTGAFALRLSVLDPGLPSTIGPQVLTCDPAPNATLDSSPLAIRIDMSGPLDPGTLIPGQTVQLIYSPSGNFKQDGQQVPLASVNFSPAIEDSPPPGGQDNSGTILHYHGINELQLFPASALAPGHYEVDLVGQSIAGSLALADLAKNDLNASAANPQGQDFEIHVPGRRDRRHRGCLHVGRHRGHCPQPGRRDVGRARAGQRRDR